MTEDELLIDLLAKAEQVAQQNLFYRDPLSQRVSISPTIVRFYDGEWWTHSPHPTQVADRLEELADQSAAIALVAAYPDTQEVAIFAMVKGFDPKGPFGEYVGAALAKQVVVNSPSDALAVMAFPGFSAEPWQETLDSLTSLPREMQELADGVSSTWLKERLAQLHSGRSL